MFYKRKHRKSRFKHRDRSGYTAPIHEPPPPAPTIPHIFHRIWLGSDPIPAQSEIWWQTWITFHPTATFHTWTDENVPNLTNQSLFDDEENLGAKSDILRIELLNLYGGIYVDTDFESLKPIWPILNDVHAFAGWESESSLNNAILGAEAGHEWLTFMIAQLPAWYAAHASEWPPVRTGPVFVTWAANQFESCIKFDIERFYSYPVWARFVEGYVWSVDDHPLAVAVHWWLGSWCDGFPYYDYQSPPPDESP